MSQRQKKFVVGRELRKIRRERLVNGKKLTQTDLARLLAVSQSVVSRLESGEINAADSLVDTFAEIYSLPENDLVRLKHLVSLKHEVRTWRLTNPLEFSGLAAHEKFVFQHYESGVSWSWRFLPPSVQEDSYAYELLRWKGIIGPPADEIVRHYSGSHLPPMTFYISEAALAAAPLVFILARIKAGDSRSGIRRQLSRLNTLVQLGNKIKLVPMDGELPPALYQHDFDCFGQEAAILRDGDEAISFMWSAAADYVKLTHQLEQHAYDVTDRIQVLTSFVDEAERDLLCGDPRVSSDLAHIMDRLKTAFHYAVLGDISSRFYEYDFHSPRGSS